MRRTPSTLEDGSVLRSRQVVLAAAAAGAAALLIGSTLAVLTLRPAVVDSDGDGVPDSVEAATQRTVVAATAGDTFTIVSRLASAPYQDQFEVSYKAGTFVVTYERARGSDSAYQLELRNLVEWNDINQNNRIDPGETVGVGTTLGTTAFANAPVTKAQVDSADGGHVTELSIRSTTANMTLNVTVAERFMRLSSTRVLTPMEVKLDLTVDRATLAAGYGPGLDVAAYEGVVARTPELQGDLVLYAASLAAAVFLIALTLIVADRRRKKREE